MKKWIVTGASGSVASACISILIKNQFAVDAYSRNELQVSNKDVNFFRVKNYDNIIFNLEEWHDSFVFDAVRVKFPQMRQLDWAAHLYNLKPHPGSSTGEGHPLINSDWGAWLDHLKGGRKKLGRSKREDLKVIRKEPYWQ